MLTLSFIFPRHHLTACRTLFPGIRGRCSTRVSFAASVFLFVLKEGGSGPGLFTGSGCGKSIAIQAEPVARPIDGMDDVFVRQVLGYFFAKIFNMGVNGPVIAFKLVSLDHAHQFRA